MTTNFLDLTHTPQEIITPLDRVRACRVCTLAPAFRACTTGCQFNGTDLRALALAEIRKEPGTKRTQILLTGINVLDAGTKLHNPFLASEGVRILRSAL